MWKTYLTAILVGYAIFASVAFCHMWFPNTRRRQYRPKRIYLLRHGESEGNLNKRIFTFMPDSKIPLTELGKEQAHAAGATLKEMIGEERVRFWVSPYKRTQQTLEFILRHFDEDKASSREDPRIREQDWGNFQDFNSTQKCRNLRDLYGRFYYRFPSGESGADVYNRVSSFLETLFRDFYSHPENENVAIISHGITCRLFLARFLHWPVEFLERTVNLENCEILILEKQLDGSYHLLTPLKEEHLQTADEWDSKLQNL